MEKYLSAEERAEFNEEQTEQIILGLREGVDVNRYADVRFSAGQMEQIRLAMEEGMDTASFALPCFGIKEMKEFREANKQREAERQEQK